VQTGAEECVACACWRVDVAGALGEAGGGEEGPTKWEEERAGEHFGWCFGWDVYRVWKSEWWMGLVMRFRWWNYVPRKARALISGLLSIVGLWSRLLSLCYLSLPTNKVGLFRLLFLSKRLQMCRFW
jgi:hypothetical protein